MRTLFAILLISAIPLGRAWADDDQYHRVQFGDRTPTGNMEYWDDNQGSHQMLMGGTSLNSGSKSLGSALTSTGQNYCSAATPLDASCQANRPVWPSSLNGRAPYSPLNLNANNAASGFQIQP